MANNIKKAVAAASSAAALSGDIITSQEMKKLLEGKRALMPWVKERIQIAHDEDDTDTLNLNGK